MNKLLLDQIESSIEAAEPEEQRQLLADLPRLLNLTPSDHALLQATEPSFGFWNNPDDDTYDQL